MELIRAARTALPPGRSAAPVWRYDLILVMLRYWPNPAHKRETGKPRRLVRLSGARTRRRALPWPSRSARRCWGPLLPRTRPRGARLVSPFVEGQQGWSSSRDGSPAGWGRIRSSTGSRRRASRRPSCGSFATWAW